MIYQADKPFDIRFFVYQYHKPFDIPFLLIYPKRVFHTLQFDERFRVYQQLQTLKPFINFINPMENGSSFYAFFRWAYY
jgi:hypothetical protein